MRFKLFESSQSEHIKTLENVEAYLTYHAWSEFIIYPYSSSYAKEANNKVELHAVAKEMVANIKGVHSKSYQFDEGATGFYPAAGGSDDWSHDLGIPLSFTIELRDKGNYGFIMPEFEIIPTCEENMEGIRAVVDHINNKASTPAPPTPEPIEQGKFSNYQVASFAVGSVGFIPQDRTHTYDHNEAKEQCALHFGKGWELARLSPHMVNLLQVNKLDHFLFWFDMNECLFVQGGTTHSAHCDQKMYDEHTGMSVLCSQSNGGAIMTKPGKIFSCNLGAIGLMQKVGSKYKEIKYKLTDCNKKRSDRSKMFKKSTGELELDYDSDGKMKSVTCKAQCKLDKQSKLTATIGCEPVFDASGTVVGARHIYDDAGFGRYQEICGGGCAPYNLRSFMGPDIEAVETSKCSKRDGHNQVRRINPLRLNHRLGQLCFEAAVSVHLSDPTGYGNDKKQVHVPMWLQ